MSFSPETGDAVDHIQESIQAHLQHMPGEVDSSGLELVILVRMVSNLYETIGRQHQGVEVLSGPRWRILLRLFAEEEQGRLDGMTPTALSRCQSVSKNTISALLRGLEEQSLISRQLDPVDRRVFRIQLTPEGRDLVRATAPQRVTALTELVSGLSPIERRQLGVLLRKLYRSLRERSPLSQEKVPAEAAGIDGGHL